jgi:hypothetical protein
MNESQLIRQQLALERAHLAAVARACAEILGGATGQEPAVPGDFGHACEAYLGCVLRWYEARDQRLGQLAAGLGSQDPRGSTVSALLASSGSASEALQKLGAAASTPGGWQGFEQFLRGPWSARRDALERLLAHESRAAHWRLIAGIDADGILQERVRFARIASLMPAGTSLSASPPRAA